VVRCTTTAPDRPTRFTGLVPAPGGSAGAGFGPWLIHQFTNIDIALLAATDGFTVRLRGGHLRDPADSAARTSTPRP
jgi:hypothetical protein